MSKVVFFNIPAYGHINPTLAVVKELINRKEEVVYYCTEEFRNTIEGTGAEFRCYQGVDDITSAFTLNRKLDNRDISIIAASLLEMCKRLIPGLMEELQSDRPEYIINDSMCPWGKILCEKLEIPFISSISTFAFNKKVYKVPFSFKLKILQSFFCFPGSLTRILCLLAELNKEYGFKIPGLIQSMMFSGKMNIVYTSRYLQPHAEMFDDSFKFIGPSIISRSEIDSFPFERLEGKSVIYICLGTLYNKSVSFYQGCIEAFKSIGILVVMAVGNNLDINSLIGIPENFIVKNHVPQIDILKHADLFITHGGMNSVSEALYYGVPMVVAPMAVDQPITAKRIEELGAGVYLRGKVNPDKLRRSANTVINNKLYRENIKKIQLSFISAGGYEKAVDVIFEFKNHSTKNH